MSAIYYPNYLSNFQKSYEWRFWKRSSFFKFKVASVSQYISRKLDSLYGKLSNSLEVIHTEMDSYSAKDCENLFKEVQRFIPKLIKQYESLEKHDFLDNTNLKNNFRKVLDYSYVIEAKAKKVVKSGRQSNKNNEENLKVALSDLSKANISSKLS